MSVRCRANVVEMIPRRNALLYNVRPGEVVPAIFWNNPHICDREKVPPVVKRMTKKPQYKPSCLYNKGRASFFNNPHVCDRKKERAPAALRQPWTQLPQWEARKNILQKQIVREERVKEDKDRFQRLRAMKYGLKMPQKAVEGRQNVGLQTCDDLEALYEDPPKFNACTQADFERPVTPPFIPAKTGVDTCTQIYPDDLFFFDEDVKPILEVTTGRTLEQALLEVLHEDEIDGMAKEKRRYLEEKDAFGAEVDRLAEEDRRKATETGERIAEMERAREDQKNLEERIAAALLSNQMCKELLPEVLDDMVAQGYYVDVTEEAVEDVMKVLETDVCEELQKIALSEDVLSGMIKDIVQNRYDLYRELGENPPNRFGPDIPELEEEEVYEEMEFEQEGLPDV